LKVRDPRQPPFIWISLTAANHLREQWSSGAGVKAATGRSVYQALCELANEAFARKDVHQHSSTFKSTLGELCERSGISDKPAAKALLELERIGLLAVQRNNADADKRAGAPAEYVLFEPGQTNGESPKVEPTGNGSEPTEKVRTTNGESPKVEDERSEKVRTPSNKEKEKQLKNEEVCAPTTDDPDSGVLSAGVAAPLRQAADAKGADFNAHSIKRALDAYPDRDHAEEAEKFAVWHLSGVGKNAPLRVVSVSFKKWLKNSAPAEKRSGATVTQLPVKPPVPDAEILKGSEEAAEAWAKVRTMLQAAVPGSTWRLWLAPLTACGAAGDTLHLAAPDGIQAWIERRYSSLIAEALERAGSPYHHVSFYCPSTDSEAAA
jgi:hypothetical protein